MTMTLVETVTVGSGGAANITFSSIPQTGTDLYLVMSLRDAFANATTNAYIRFNGTTTGYTERRLSGNGSTAASNSRTGLTYFVDLNQPGSTATSNTFGNASLYVSNYAGSTTKSASGDYVTENNTTTASAGINAFLWSNTAAITSISILASDTVLSQYSTASLYTITKGSGGATVS